LVFQKRPCGDGVVDFRKILPILAAGKPDINLTIENDQPFEDLPRAVLSMHIDIFDPPWLAGHPDLTVAEFAAFMEMVRDHERRVVAGEVPDIETYAALPHGYAETIDFIKTSAEHLRGICRAQNLPLA
jgi:hypothetical protein